MLNSGERQVSPTLDGIRRDHVARYEWAAERLAGRSVVDAACGIGYGSHILAANCKVLGVDRDKETIAYARANYAEQGATFLCKDIANGLLLAPTNAAVCFETIEHIEDPRTLLKTLHESVAVLLASVPNEEVFPWKNYAFHFRHYTKAEFTALLRECGWEPVEWYGQEGPESEVEPNVNGRTLIAVCERREAVPPSSPDPRATLAEALGVSIPEHVAIVGLGPSINEFVDLTKRLGGSSAFCDEVWGINALGDVLKCDLVFHMDDIRIQESRAAARPQSNIANMVRWLKKYEGTVITSREHPDYPCLEAFPLEQAINELGHAYFNNTAAYAVAYAILSGVKKISLFGCDYTYPNAHDAEKGRACLEFWLGYARAKGIKVAMPKTTTLMDALYTDEERLYGYDTVHVTVSGLPGSFTVDFEERATVATAEEIEERYDHSAHPNALVSNQKEPNA